MQLRSHRATTDIDAVITVESAKFAYKAIDDQLIEPLQELSAQIVVEEVYETQTKSLLALFVVPMTHMVQVYTLIHRF